MSIPSWARVGAKVVCIENPPLDVVDDACVGRPLPRKGAIYAITEAGEYPGLVWIGIAELDPAIAYSVEFFRPAVTREDDLKAHFAHLLDAPVRVSEEA